MQKYSPALVVATWVMVLALSGAAIALRSFRNSLQTEFNTTADTRIAALQRNLDEKLLILQSMQSLYSVFDGKPQPQFRTFVQPFEKRLEGVRALQWVVPVANSEREKFEQQLRDAGIAGYQITERTPSGNMVRAAERAMYFPVYPLLPLDVGEASIGFDLASSPVRKQALDRAIEHNTLAASDSFALLQEQDAGLHGFLVVDPLFSKHEQNADGSPRLLGLVLGVFRISDLVNVANAAFTPEALTMTIRNEDAPADASLLFSQNDGADGGSGGNGTQENWFDRRFQPHEYSRHIQVADRQWLVSAQPAAGYMQHRHAYVAWLVLAAGLALAFALSLYLRIRGQHEMRLLQGAKQREALENLLLRAQRLEAIGQLVGGIAHDFRNLLHSIIGNVELLMHESADPKSQTRHHLYHIERAAERGNGLIQKLLSFSRNDPKPAQLQDLAPLVQSTLEMMRPIIPATINFQLDLAEGLPPVLIDASSFDQILVNLCINARDAINGAGSIKVSLSLATLPVTECHSCHSSLAGEFVQLELGDTGSGIAADKLSHIFEPFFTTKSNDKGTGLGLAIVHNIVHSASGHILLDSIPGQGSTFRILFPVDQHAVVRNLRSVG